MPRGVCKASAVISLLLLLATALLWVRSYYRSYSIANPEHDIPSGTLRTRIGATCCRGEFFIVVARQRETYGDGCWLSMKVDDTLKIIMDLLYQSFPSRFAGFAWGTSYTSSDGVWAKGCAFPMWFAIILFAITPLLWVRALHRSRRSEGCCPACNYNLTGNVSGVCPECGAKVA